MRRFHVHGRLLALFVVISMLAACGATPAETSPTTAPAAAATTAPAAAAPTAPAAATTAPDASAPATGATTGQGPCTPEAASTERPEPIFEIGTGNTGGVFFPYGGGIARVLTQKLPGAQVTAQETGGSVDNMNLILNGEAALGMSTVDSAYDGLLGQGAYTAAVPACAIAVLYNSFVHIVASEASGINTVEDMKGKTISVGSAGSSTEGAADRVLAAAGLDPKADISRQNLSVNDSVAAMKDGKVDGFFWIGGLPTSAVTDLTTTSNVKVKFVPAGQYVAALTAKYGPVYTELALPKDVYSGVAADVPGIGIGNILFVSATMNEGLAYDITKTIFDNLADVQASHPAAKALTLETATVGSSIPFHPGAIRYFTEKGVYKP